MQLGKFAAIVCVVAVVCLAVTAGCAVAVSSGAPQQGWTPCYHPYPPHHGYLSCPYDPGQCPADCGWSEPRYAESHHRHHCRC